MQHRQHLTHPRAANPSGMKAGRSKKLPTHGGTTCNKEGGSPGVPRRARVPSTDGDVWLVRGIARYGAAEEEGRNMHPLGDRVSGFAPELCS